MINNNNKLDMKAVKKVKHFPDRFFFFFGLLTKQIPFTIGNKTADITSTVIL